MQTSPGPGEAIEDFVSPSSNSADEAFPPEPSSSVVLTLNKASRKSSKAWLPVHHFEWRPDSSPPDHMTISTPPSSPELDSVSTEGEEGRLKASDWIKQVREVYRGACSILRLTGSASSDLHCSYPTQLVDFRFSKPRERTYVLIFIHTVKPVNSGP